MGLKESSQDNHAFQTEEGKTKWPMPVRPKVRSWVARRISEQHSHMQTEIARLKAEVERLRAFAPDEQELIRRQKHANAAAELEEKYGKDLFDTIPEDVYGGMKVARPSRMKAKGLTIGTRENLTHLVDDLPGGHVLPGKKVFDAEGVQNALEHEAEALKAKAEERGRLGGREIGRRKKRDAT